MTTAVAKDGLNASGLVSTVFHFDFAAGAVVTGVVERGLVAGVEERWSWAEVVVGWRKVLRKVSCVDWGKMHHFCIIIIIFVLVER